MRRLEPYFKAIFPPGICENMYPQKKLPRMTDWVFGSQSNSPSTYR